MKSGLSAVIAAIAWNGGDVPANDAARKNRSGSMMNAPAVERRSATAVSSDTRTTATGGEMPSRSG